MDWIQLELLSDATFSRGSGTPGEVDVEVAHDHLGLPRVPGRTIKGLLRDSWLAMSPYFAHLAAAAAEALGAPGDVRPAGGARCWIGDAELHPRVREWIEWALTRDENPVSSEDVFRGFTAIRRQTARDRRSGGPETGSLRSSRVILRTLELYAPLVAEGFDDRHWEVLGYACLGVRQAGVGRNRGRGHLRLHLLRDRADYTEQLARNLAPGKGT